MNKRTVMAVALGLVACTSWAATNVIADPGEQDRGLTAATPETTPPVLEVMGPPTAGDNAAGFGGITATFTTEAPPSAKGQGSGGGGAPRALCGGSQTISLNIDPVTFNPATGARCPNPNENAFARCFPASLFLPPEVPFNLICLDMPIRFDGSPGAPYDTTVNLTFITDCNQATVEGLGWPASAAPARSITVTLPGDGTLDGQFISVPVTPPLLLDGSLGGLLVEWHKATGAGDLVPGNNQLGSTCDPVPGACAYLWSPPCGVALYQDTVQVGFPADWLFNLGGDPFNLPVSCCNDTPAPGSCDDTGMLLVQDCLGPNQRFILGGGNCPAFDPPCGMGACCVNDGTPDGSCSLTTVTGCVIVDPVTPPLGTAFRWDGGMNCADVSCAPPPPNNDCRFAINANPAGEPSVSLIYTTAGSLDDGLVVDAPACGPIFKTAWYTYTVPVTAFGFGNIVVSTIGSSYDSYYVVYDHAAVPFQRCVQISNGIIPELLPGIDTTCRQNDVSANNALSYQIFPVVDGNLLTIRVGGSAAGDGGPGVLNIDLIETPGLDTRCCFSDGTCTNMPLTDCEIAGGFWDTETNFYEGILPDPLTPETGEFLGLGCNTLPCPVAGNACWNPLDLETMLPGPPVVDVRQEVTLTTRQKLYLKWNLLPGEIVTIDTCGTAESVEGFDTIIEAFGGFGPDISGTSNAACITPITTSLSGGVNNTCDIPDDVQLCRATTNSCMCVSFSDALNAGAIQEPDGSINVIFCIGTPNTGTDVTVNSVDPVLNPFDPPADVVVGATTRAACVICEVLGDQVGEIFEVPDPITGVPVQVFPIDEAAPPPPATPELACVDGQSNRNNDGCSVGGALLTVAIPEPTHGAPPTYVYGSAGVYNDLNLGQRSDEDWYSFTLSQATRLSARLVQAEFPAQMVIFRAGPMDPCNVGGLAITTALDCIDATFTVDACAGDYFLVIRSVAPDKPPCGAEYLMGISGEAVPAGAHCSCPADLNNDDKVDGLDIELFVSTVLNPPVALPDADAGTLGGCFVQAACAADIDGDGDVTVSDVPGFTAALLAGAPCPAVLPCEASNKCQIPNQQGQGAGGTLCIFDDVSRGLTGAENFIPLEDGSITSACWWGPMVTSSTPCVPPLGDGVTTFNIRYYDDAAGLPGTMIAEFLGVTPASATVTGNVLVSGIGDLEEVEFTANHAPVAVTAGQCYWIEIQGDSSAACFFCWETAPAGDGSSIQGTGAPFVAGDVNGFDLAFCVDVRIADNGCIGPVADPTGQCCFLGELGPDCVETTSLRCDVIYDGYNFDPAADCTVCCPPPDCEVTCQGGDLLENEGCNFDKNGGCNSTPSAFEDIGVLTCVPPTPITICGNSFSQFSAGGIRDTDWFSFTLANTSDVTITLEADTSVTSFLINSAICPAGTVLGNGVVGNNACIPVSEVLSLLAPGTYTLFVGGSTTEVHGCVKYRITIECSEPVICQATCPVGGIAETELCGGDTNGGCNDPLCNPGPCGPPPPPTVFEPLPLACPNGSVTVCGTGFANAALRDTDWWGPVNLAQDTDVTVTLNADFTASTFAIEVSDCALLNTFSNGIATSSGCVDASFSECLPAGSWVFFVAATNADGSPRFEGSPCGFPDPSYILTVACGAQPCAGGPAGVTCGAVPAGCQSPSLTFGNISDQDQDMTVIDDFTPVATGNVTSICWWGFEDDLLTPASQDCTGVAPDSFEITYYADGVGNLPDLATIVGGPFTVSPIRTVEQPTPGGSTVFRYELAAPHAPVPVTAGVCTWVEIKQVTTECFCTWVWMSSDQASGNGRLADNTGGVLTPIFDDASFCVDVAVDPALAACPVLGACCIIPVAAPVCIATETEAACLARPESPTWHRFEDCATFVCPVPPQDSCLNAGDITSFINGAPILGDNSTATPPQHDGNPALDDPELPAGSPTCQWNGVPGDAHNTVWWTLVAPANGSLTIETCGLGGGGAIEDTIIALYSGTCGALVEVGCGEDECTGAAPWLSRITTTTLTAGTTYHLMLANTGSYAGSIPGAFQVDITSP